MCKLLGKTPGKAGILPLNYARKLFGHNSLRSNGGIAYVELTALLKPCDVKSYLVSTAWEGAERVKTARKAGTLNRARGSKPRSSDDVRLASDSARVRLSCIYAVLCRNSQAAADNVVDAITAMGQSCGQIVLIVPPWRYTWRQAVIT